VVEEKEEGVGGEEEKAPVERKKEYTSAYVTEVTDDLRFYAQKEDQGSKLVALMDELTQAFTANPPLGGSYTPKKGTVFISSLICLKMSCFLLNMLLFLGDLCAAKFTDGIWYRARVEKMAKGGSNVEVFYVDYGNRESVASSNCASLPSAFTSAKPYAHEYTLGCVKLPSDVR